MTLQVMKVTAVVLADVGDAKAFGEAIQDVLSQAAKKHLDDTMFTHRRVPALTILSASNSVVPAPKDLTARYTELEQRANEAVASSVERA